MDQPVGDGVGNAGYWSAMAAIAPILALTLVVEARYAAKDWAGFRHRWWAKLVVALGFSAAAVGCVTVMTTALLRLLNPDILGLSAMAALFLVAFATGIVVLGAITGEFLEPMFRPSTAGPARAAKRPIAGRPRTRRLTAGANPTPQHRRRIRASAGRWRRG